jgi:hypothetical protein
MNKLFIITLKLLRKCYAKLYGAKILDLSICDRSPDSVSQKIYDILIKDAPCMIARFGSTELSCVINGLGVKKTDNNIIDYVKGKSSPW